MACDWTGGVKVGGTISSPISIDDSDDGGDMDEEDAPVYHVNGVRKTSKYRGMSLRAEP